MLEPGGKGFYHFDMGRTVTVARMAAAREKSARDISAAPSRFALLRRAVLVRVFALFAMCLQVLFYADHIGAAAAAEIGNPPAGARLGLLQICTGDGIVLMTPDGRELPNAPAQPSHDSGQCSVCTSASVCGFDAPAALMMPLFQAQIITPTRVFAPVRAPRILHIRTLRPIRAPPRL